jgi:hypothetical protein
MGNYFASIVSNQIGYSTIYIARFVPGIFGGILTTCGVILPLSRKENAVPADVCLPLKQKNRLAFRPDGSLNHRLPQALA